MKRFLPALLGGMLLPQFLAAAPDTALAPQIALWNGKDLTGWTFVAKPGVAPSYTIHDGVLASNKTVGYLRTVAKYTDYHLHVEWRWPVKTGNSGVLVDISGEDVVWPNCIQCQVKGDSTGDLLGMKGYDFGKPLVNGNQLAAKTGAPAEKPVGEWNRYDITCKNGTIDLVVNGVPENHLEKLPTPSGFIALQMEGPAVEFRNVWLQPL
ncbi:MAG: DUF1080 domain-containing protein [Chthoniobacteraceae bacterium]